MATTQLSLYNGALRLCEERKLASLSEAREARRMLDDVWDDGAIDACLEMGLWSFALRTVELTYDPALSPDFGLSYVFALPDDFVQINEMSTDDRFSTPMNGFRIETGRIFADVQTIYLSYVSNDAAYGRDLSRWPQSFQALVQAYLANDIVGRMTASSDLVKKVDYRFNRALTAALGKDAVKKPARSMARGSWVSARIGGGGSSGDPQRRTY